MPASNSGKVRIIGGCWKRTNIPVLNADGLRPTGDRQRETLFNWLTFLLGGFEGRSASDALVYVESPQEISNEMLASLSLSAVRRLKAGASYMLLAQKTENPS